MRSSTLGIRCWQVPSQQGRLGTGVGLADRPDSLATEADLLENRRSAFQAGRRSGFGSGFGGSGFDDFTGAVAARAGHVTAAVVVAVATIATLAAFATMTEQTTTAVAAMAALATVTSLAIDVAVAATASAVAANTTIAAITAVTTMASHRGLLTTEQSDADDREEDRDSENHNTIHSKFLQVTSQVP